MGIADPKNGFSTIELLAVVTLTAIVAAIALPSWRGLLPNYALNNSTRQIQSELHHLKMRAVAENVGFQLAYQVGANQYSIYRDSQLLATKPLAEGATITKAGTINFSPRGTAGANRVRLSNADGKCQQIVVSATGRVRVCTPNLCSQDC
jgi:prepilin-type N-terminal cleavage/methylation domain-containing protein